MIVSFCLPTWSASQSNLFIAWCFYDSRFCICINNGVIRWHIEIHWYSIDTAKKFHVNFLQNGSSPWSKLILSHICTHHSVLDSNFCHLLSLMLFLRTELHTNSDTLHRIVISYCSCCFDLWYLPWTHCDFLLLHNYLFFAISRHEVQIISSTSDAFHLLFLLTFVPPFLGGTWSSIFMMGALALAQNLWYSNYELLCLFSNIDSTLGNLVIACGFWCCNISLLLATFMAW